MGSVGGLGSSWIGSRMSCYQQKQPQQQSQRSLFFPRAKTSSGKFQASSNSGAGFWERLQQAWGVLLDGSSSSLPVNSRRSRLKRRFSSLLVADRGFDSQSLSLFYDLAKGAISQHVVLEEGDEQEQGTATVERLGELQFQFSVRRVRSSAEDEPWARPTLVEYEP